MECSFFAPTKVIIGDNCIGIHSGLLAGLGKKAFIVTSPSSAKNGSLADLTGAMEREGIAYAVYAKTPQNPDLNSVGEMGREAGTFGCDFVIGLGGGSAMDAAKAVAVLAANGMEAEGVYEQPWKNKPLPVVEVPTTCGTGSEVTAVSVLTYGDTKKSFKSEDVIPKIAFLDARYLESLPQSITADTAVDALSHAAEGYLMADNWISDMFAERVFEFFGLCKQSLLSGKYTHEIRERMLFMAMLAGHAINITGTSAVHAMGYPITTLRNVPHGRACGILLGEYVEFSYSAREEKINKMLSLLGRSGTEDFKKLLSGLLGEKERYTAGELEKYTDISLKAATGRANPVKMERKDVLDLYIKSLM